MSAKVNPFVKNAIDIIRERGTDISVAELVKLLGDREPALSLFNLECAAREALRVAPQIFAEEQAREEARRREDEERRRQAEEQAAAEEAVQRALVKRLFAHCRNYNRATLEELEVKIESALEHGWIREEQRKLGTLYFWADEEADEEPDA